MIKLIAIFTMLIDHLGIFIFHDNYYFRLIGRVAFPLFAALLAFNYLNRTHDSKKFFYRLLLFAFLSQPFYMFAFQTIELNIFFQFIWGILTFESFRYFLKNQKITRFVLFMLVFFVCFFLSIYTTYQGFGFFTVFILFLYLYSLKKNFYNLKLFKYSLITLLAESLLFLNPWKYWISVFINLIFILYLEKIESFKQQYFREINKKYRYFFYWFYPLHIFVLKIIQLFL